MAKIFNKVFPIYNADGTSFHNLVLRKATYDSVVMSLGDKITGEVVYKDNKLQVTMHEYVEYNDVRYVLVNPPTIIREGLVKDNSDLKGMTKYSFEFYHPMCQLSNIPFTDVAVSSNEQQYLSQNKTFSWAGTGYNFIAKINKNLQGTQWIVVASDNEKSSALLSVLPSDITPTKADSKQKSDVLSFDKNFISDALKTMYDTWGVPFVIDSLHRGEYYDINGIDYYTQEGGSKRFVIIVGLPSNEIKGEDGENFVFQYGQGLGLKNSSRTPKNNKIVTRISGYGSEDNIPYGYPQIPWYGDQSWKYTINNTSGVQEITIGGVTYHAMSYPIYDGIVGGSPVKLIKHPFTRTKLMPSIYSRTVFNKVSPYAERVITPLPEYNQTLSQLLEMIDTRISQATKESETKGLQALRQTVLDVNNVAGAAAQTFSGGSGSDAYNGYVRKQASELINGYVEGVTGDIDFEGVLDTAKFTSEITENMNFNPDGEIVDFYDATAPAYPNPIVLDAPSYEIHEFEKIKPELGEVAITDAYPYDEAGVSYKTYEQWYDFMNEMLTELRATGKNGYEFDIIVYLRELTCPCPPEQVTPSTMIEPFHNEWNTGSVTATIDISIKGNYVYIKIVSPWYNTTWKVLQINKTEPVAEWDDTMDDDGKYIQEYFKMTLPVLSFDLYASAAITQEMQVYMRSGSCLGCTFTVQVDWDDYKANFFTADGIFDPVIGTGHPRNGEKYPDSTQTPITIILQKETETFGTLMPNTYQHPVAGDKFVILGISLPLSYITEAELRLDEASMQYMLENNIYHFEYPLKFDEYFLATHLDILSQIRNNTIVRFQYADEPTMALYVKQITIKYGSSPLPQYDITLTDDVEIVLNQIGQVTDDVSRVRIELSELQKYYSQNLIKEINNKLSRVADDVAMGHITFQEGLTAVGSIILSSDIRSSNFVSGMDGTGRGWHFDNLGNGEVESLRVRSYLEVVELLINRLHAQEGDTLFTDNDQIEKVDIAGYVMVTPEGDENPSFEPWYERSGEDGDYTYVLTTDTTVNVSKTYYRAYYLLSLKEKWDGYFTAQQEGNIIKGIINTLAAQQGKVSEVTESQSVESDGANKYYTSWMVMENPSVVGLSTLERNQIVVRLWGAKNEGGDFDTEDGIATKGVPAQRNFPPCELMTIARWGCVGDPDDPELTDGERQSIRRRQRIFSISVSDGRIAKLTRVCQPILYDWNYGTTLGVIPDFINNWSIRSRLIDGRDYLYAQGVIVGDFIKVDINGVPIVNYVDCGEWVDGSKVETPAIGKGIYLNNGYNAVNLQWETHNVWHNGSYWRCLVSEPVNGTYYEPTDENGTYWKKLLTSGTQGSDGHNTAIVYLYQRSTTDISGKASTKPSQALYYNFNNKKLYTDAACLHIMDVSNGWHQVLPSGTDPIYIIAATAYSKGNVDDIGINEWSDTVLLADKGKDGLNNATVFLYKRGSSISSHGITSLLYYKFANGKLYSNAEGTTEASSSDLNGWSLIFPASQSNGQPCYVIQATAINTSAIDAIPNTEWSAPKLMVEDGDSPLLLDIDNEMDMLQTDSGRRVLNVTSISTSVRLFKGSQPVDINNNTPSIGSITYRTTASGQAVTLQPSLAYNSANKAWTIGWSFNSGWYLTMDKYDVSVTVTYNNVTYTARFTLVASLGNAVYQLNPSRNELSFSRASGSSGLTPDQYLVYCGYKKTDGNAVVVYDGKTSAHLQDIDGKYNIFYRTYNKAGNSSAWGWVKDLTDTSFAVQVNASDNYSAIEFCMSSATAYTSVSDANIIDRETIPVIRDGVNGESPNQNILLSTVFDRGLDKVKEEWTTNGANYWESKLYVDSASDTIVEGRKSLRLNASALAYNQYVDFEQDVKARIKPSTWYTLSFYSFCSTGDGTLANEFFDVHIYSGNNSYPIIDTGSVFYVDGESAERTNDGRARFQQGWNGTRHTVTFKTASSFNSGLKAAVLFRCYGLKQLAICMPKLEEGTVATPYIANELDLIGEQGEDGESTVMYKIVTDKDTMLPTTDGEVNVYVRKFVGKDSVTTYTLSDLPTGLTLTAFVDSTNITEYIEYDDSQIYGFGIVAGQMLTIRLKLNNNDVDIKTIQCVANGAAGERGKTGKNYYYGGDFDSTNKVDKFTSNDYETPYFTYNNNKWLWVGADFTNMTMFALAKSYGLPTVSNDNWEIMVTDFKYLISQAIFTDFAKLGSGVFNKDWMYSQYGMKEVLLRTTNSPTTISEENYKEIPYQTAMSVMEGRKYKYNIQTKHTSGKDVGLFIRVYYMPEGTTAWVQGKDYISTNVNSSSTLSLTFMAEYTGQTKLYYYGYGECGSITTDTSQAYQTMNPMFVNRNPVTFFEGTWATRNTSYSLIVNTSFTIRANCKYQFKITGFVDGEDTSLVVRAFEKNTDTEIIWSSGVANICSISNTSSSTSSVTLVAASDKEVQLKAYSTKSTVYAHITKITITSTDGFVPSVAIDWLSGYSHFSRGNVRFDPDGAAYFKGQIEARSGHIADFEISGSSLRSDGDGIVLNADGSATIGNMEIEETGDVTIRGLTATDGDFSGKITATSGTFGGFTAIKKGLAEYVTSPPISFKMEGGTLGGDVWTMDTTSPLAHITDSSITEVWLPSAPVGNSLVVVVNNTGHQITVCPTSGGYTSRGYSFLTGETNITLNDKQTFIGIFLGGNTIGNEHKCAIISIR